MEQMEYDILGSFETPNQVNIQSQLDSYLASDSNIKKGILVNYMSYCKGRERCFELYNMDRAIANKAYKEYVKQGLKDAKQGILEWI